jgi:NodT family efflux transporter outer membrane factor (OMF) lipoprotein
MAASRIRTLWFFAALASMAVLSGCTVGPRYARPTAPVPPAYKEEPPGWKTAQPSDQIAKGKWWEIYQDPQLNALEEKVNVSNQTLKASVAQFEQARAMVRQFRADYYPTVTVGASGSRNRLSEHRGVFTSQPVYTDLQIPIVGVSYEPDLFGRVRKTVEEARSNAQASAGDVENVSLSVHADLAVDYFSVRTLDAEEQLLRDTVDAFQKALELTQNRYSGGVASGVDVAQAQTQLESTRAQMIDVQVARSQFEHAAAVLVGEPASTFSIPFAPWNTPPPIIPAGVPSDLMERRPDIATAERRVAAANAQIGVARTGYFPMFNLSGAGGFESSTITNLISGPSGFLSLGASAVVTAFDVGRRRAISDEAKAAYDQSVANYRQTLLTSFQEVEDSLSALRILEQEARTQQDAVAAAQHSLELSTNRYKGGVTTYLEVTTAQEFALTDERAAVEILSRRMTASVQLIQALGGGWDANSLNKIQMTSTQPHSPQSRDVSTQVLARP